MKLELLIYTSLAVQTMCFLTCAVVMGILFSKVRFQIDISAILLVVAYFLNFGVKFFQVALLVSKEGRKLQTVYSDYNCSMITHVIKDAKMDFMYIFDFITFSMINIILVYMVFETRLIELAVKLVHF